MWCRSNSSTSPNSSTLRRFYALIDSLCAISVHLVDREFVCNNVTASIGSEYMMSLFIDIISNLKTPTCEQDRSGDSYKDEGDCEYGE